MHAEKERTYESNRRSSAAGRERAGTRRTGFDGDEAVAWAEYGTRRNCRTSTTASSTRPGSTAPDYRITCIFVDQRYRRAGSRRWRLRGALDLIAQAGGGVVEGYPHDMSKQPGKKVSSSFLYNGTRRMYEQAGFSYDRDKGKSHSVMRKTVTQLAQSGQERPPGNPSPVLPRLIELPSLAGTIRPPDP